MVREILLVVAAYYLYSIAKNLVHPTPYAEGFKNAWSVVSLERALGIFQESNLQSWLMQDARWAVVFLNWVYTIGFFPMMLLTAVVFFVNDRVTYYRFRSIMLVSFGIGVTIFAIFPLAPPWMLGYMGFENTVHLLGPGQYSSSSDLVSYNKYAAMPSMHFAWAVLLAMAWASTQVLWAKIAAVVYQTLMALAVVVTGNHYFVDVIVAVPVVMASFYLHQLLTTRPQVVTDNRGPTL